MARVEITFGGESRGAVGAAKATANALKDVRKQAGESSVTLGHHSKSLSEGEKEMGRFARGAAAGSGLLSHFGRSVAFASGAFLGAAGFTEVVKSSIEAGSELETQMVRTSKVFGDQAGVIKSWSTGSAESLRLTRSAALEAASTFGTLLANMGVAPEKVAPMSKSLVQLAADMAAFKGVKPEVALQALEAAVAGRTRGLKQLGVTIDATMVKQEAEREGLVRSTVDTGKVKDAELQLEIAEQRLADAIKKHGDRSIEAAQATANLHKAQDAAKAAAEGHAEALTSAQKATATYNLVMQQTTKQQGAVERTSHTLAGETATLHAQIGDLQEELGTALIPMLTKYLPLLTGWIARNEKNGTFQRDFNKAVRVARDVIDDAVPVVRRIVGLFQRFSEHVGGTGNALEILGGVFIGAKFGGPLLTVIGNMRKLRNALVAANIAAGEKGLLGSLTKLGRIAATGIVIGVEIDIIRKAIGAGALSGLSRSGDSIPIWNGKQWVDPATGKAVADQTYWNKQFGIGTPLKGEGAYGSGGMGLPSVPSAPATRGIQASLTATAKTALGNPYSYGGAPSLSKPTDCSGLMVAVFQQNGISLPRTSQEQFAQAPIKNAKPLLPGDLVFSEGVHPGHVGLYIGDGQVLEDPHTGDHVKIVPLTGFGWNGESARWWGGAKKTGGGGGTGAAGVTAPPANDTAPPTASGTGGRTFREKPRPGDAVQKRIEVLDTAVSRAKALTPKNTADDLRALRAERDYIKQRIVEGHATKELYDQLASLNDEIDSLATPKKAPRTGVGLLSAGVRAALADARGTKGLDDDLAALKRARAELEKKPQTVPVKEELANINRQINAIDDKKAKTRLEAIARRYAETAKKVKASIDAQSAAWDKHLQHLKDVADEAKKDFEDKWSTAANAVMRAFDKATKAGLDALAAPAETPEERALREFREGRAQTVHEKQLRTLQQALADAQNLQQNADEDAADYTRRRDDAVKQAQSDLDNFMLDEQEATLQAAADASRTAADATAAQAQQDYQDQRDIARDGLQKWLDEQEAKLEDGQTQWATFFDALKDRASDGGWDAGTAFWAAWDAANSAHDVEVRTGNQATGAADAGFGAAGADTLQSLHDAVVAGTISADTYRFLLRGRKLDPALGFATGGWSSGVRPTTMDPRDTINARLRPGEYVMSPEEVEAGRPRWSSGGDTHHWHVTVLGATSREVEDALGRIARAGQSRIGPTIYMGR